MTEHEIIEALKRLEAKMDGLCADMVDVKRCLTAVDIAADRLAKLNRDDAIREMHDDAIRAMQDEVHLLNTECTLFRVRAMHAAALRELKAPEQAVPPAASTRPWYVRVIKMGSTK